MTLYSGKFEGNKMQSKQKYIPFYPTEPSQNSRIFYQWGDTVQSFSGNICMRRDQLAASEIAV